jgi:MFS family permease
MGSTTAAVAAGASAPALSDKARSAAWAAFFGFFTDMFDVYLPIVALGPASAYFEPPQISALASTLLSAMVFIAALIGRPLGALIFGSYSDRLGRKRAAQIAVAGFGVVTLLIGLMPGYEQWGLTAVIILIALRLLDGIFLGGEYTGATTLAMEFCPPARRGFVGGCVMAGFPLAYVAISFVTMLMLRVAPAGGLHSPYVQWGWRVPFFAGAALAFGWVAYVHFQVFESETWQEAKKSGSPVRHLFSGRNAIDLLQIFVLMTGFWLVVYMVAAVMPGLLKSSVGLRPLEVTIVLMIGNVAAAAAYVAAGAISDRIGRRTFLMLWGVLIVFVASCLYYTIVESRGRALGSVCALVVALYLASIPIWGLASSYINERFHTAVRSSGFGLGYSLAVIIPSFYAFFQSWMAGLMPYKYTAIPLLVLGGLLVLVGAAWGPETKDVDFG